MSGTVRRRRSATLRPDISVSGKERFFPAICGGGTVWAISNTDVALGE